MDKIIEENEDLEQTKMLNKISGVFVMKIVNKVIPDYKNEMKYLEKHAVFLIFPSRDSLIRLIGNVLVLGDKPIVKYVSVEEMIEINPKFTIPLKYKDSTDIGFIVIAACLDEGILGTPLSEHIETFSCTAIML